MAQRHDPGLLAALSLVAPGQPLREGIDRILQAKMGALVVVGDEPEVLSICSGGFLLDAEYSPQRLSELAKMDGAIILAAHASRIARANVHLLPDPNVGTSETGTRHRTAERVARHIGVTVVAVSEEMSVITVYHGLQKHVVAPVGRILDLATQSLSALERYKARLDEVTAELSIHEIADQVNVREVVLVVQRSEMVQRLADETRSLLVELGSEGRLVRLQLDELLADVEADRARLLRDYLPIDGEWRDGGRKQLSAIDLDDLDLAVVARAVGLDRIANERLSSGQLLGTHLSPRGFRTLARIPRLSDGAIEHIVGHFGSLASILDADIAALVEVDGIGEVRARTICEGLNRVVESITADVRSR
jgi:diadenylate cyclase